jgi:hypothetical protein
MADNLTDGPPATAAIRTLECGAGGTSTAATGLLPMGLAVLPPHLPSAKRSIGQVHLLLFSFPDSCSTFWMCEMKHLLQHVSSTNSPLRFPAD